jgi:hypothetical protein
MGYGLALGFEYFVQSLGEKILWCIIMCMSWWVHEGGRV